MTDFQWLLLIAAMFATLLPGSIVLLAFKVRGMITVTVTTPPVTVNQAPITVQAPTALLPERVQMTLDAIDAKLAPAKVNLEDVKVTEVIREGVLLAERSDLRGPDRFRIAKTHALSRLTALNAEFDDADVARRIEVEVTRKKTRP
jgi:hypothetical protein